MSLRGVGKALYRTPHQLFGQKTPEDTIFKQWEHDIKSAVAGLEYLKAENNNLKSFWISFITNFIQILNIFRDLHCDLVDQANNKTVDKNEMFTNITMHELEQASKLAKILLEKTTRLANEASESFSSKCNEMMQYLKSAEKLIIKRDHKKIDYDMVTKRLDSILKNNISTEKESAKLESEQQKYSEAEFIFNDFNDKVKLIIPEVLSNLSEFINKLTYKLYFSNLDIITFIQRNLSKFSRLHGIVEDEKILDYEIIINDFNCLYTQAQDKLENLVLLRDYRQFRNKNLSEKTVHQVNNVAGSVVDTTVNLTSSIYTKASKPSQKISMSLSEKPMKVENPVKPFDKRGIFYNALDPIEFTIQHEIQSGNSNPDTSFENKEEDNDGKSDNTKSNFAPSHINDLNDWMKPPTKSAINQDMKESTPTTPTFDTSDTMSANSTMSSYNNSGKRVLSVGTNTDTYKYVNISMNSVTNEIQMLLSTPEIDEAPVIIPKPDLCIRNRKLKDYFVAKSSITANAFAAYYDI